MNQLKFLTLLLIFNSCAQIVVPEGGTKDINPPQLVKSSPPSGSVNTYPKKIILVFDENVEIKNKTEITITPDINTNPNIKAEKNRVEILIPKDSLKANTTYSVNFKKSIVDLNEGNILTNFNYKFSTGNVLDTLYIAGFVSDVKENKPQEGIKVILNGNNNLKYTTSTDVKGTWALYNIAKGNYTLLIFQDKNNNKNLDNAETYFTESIFLTDSSNIFKNKLITYAAAIKKKTKVNAVKYINDYTVSIKFNNPIPDIEKIKYSLSNEFNKKENPLTKTNKNDSFILYHPFYSNDSLLLSIQTDTLQKLLVIQPKNRKKAPLNISPDLNFIRPGDPVYLKTSIPIKLINSEKIKINGSNSGFEVKLITPYKISVNHNQNIKKEIILENGAFTDMNGEDNLTDTISIQIAEGEQTGNYEFTIKDSLNQYTGTVIVKISDENNEYLIKTEINKPNKLEGLLPGNYTIEIWEDENNNGIWDEGNYFDKIYPEKILVLKDFILIKPNWDTAGVNIYLD